MFCSMANMTPISSVKYSGRPLPHSITAIMIRNRIMTYVMALIFLLIGISELPPFELKCF